MASATAPFRSKGEDTSLKLAQTWAQILAPSLVSSLTLSGNFPRGLWWYLRYQSPQLWMPSMAGRLWASALWKHLELPCSL